jgi:hypothetical protein
MNMKERRKGPVRRGGMGRGRPPARKEGEGSTPVKKKGERGDQNWTKKFEEGDFDDLFDSDLDEDDAGEILRDGDEPDAEEETR